MASRAIFLHGRRIPRSSADIDLLVVASSGVWIVDSKHWSGRVERRNVGGWFRTDLRLFVGGRDRSKTVDGMDRQMQAIRDAWAIPGVPVTPVLCFVDTDWGLFPKSFTFQGVWVTWAQHLAELILRVHAYDRSDVENMATVVAARLRAM